MGTSPQRWILAITTIVLFTNNTEAFSAAIPARTHEEARAKLAKYCIGEYAGKKITSAQLQIVVDRHQTWLRDYDTEQKRSSFIRDLQTDPRRANLCGVDLAVLNMTLDESISALDIRNKNSSKFENVNGLSSKNLSGADLSAANLSGVNLRDANLSMADLEGANLSGADLSSANLSGAELGTANLIGADLSYANLSGARMLVADLSGTNLHETNLDDAFMVSVDLSGAIFEPESFPKIEYLAVAYNLDQVHSISSPQALYKLRKAFNEAGYRQQERAITYAIKHSEQERGRTIWDKVENIFNYVFFELPTKWGMYPGQALRVLAILIGIFSIPYIVALRYPRHGRIYRRWGEHNTLSLDASSKLNERGHTVLPPDETESLQYNWYYAILTGIQFSLLSAFNIGWRDLNVGNWISRLQPRDYTLYATGWVRSVAGTQALISVYLLAMWVLTYFGRPFD